MSINPTMAAVLGLLHDGEMTGGQVNALAQKWLSPFWTTTRSQVYRELPTMVNLGYVKAGPVGSRNSVPYKITAAGKRAFQAWLKQEPADDLIRSEAVLRLAFGSLHKGDTLEEMLIALREKHEEAVTEIAGLLREAEDSEMDYDVHALRFAIIYHQAAIGWLETVELPD